MLAGLRDIAEHLLARELIQENGPPTQIGLCLIDSGYKPDLVRAALRLVGRSATLRASHGRGITAGKTQFDDYRRDRCREMGLHWWVPKDSPNFAIQIDTNFWKSFIHSRLATAQGDPGALTLFGKPEDHALFAGHILSEYYTLPSTEKGVPIQEWHQHVGKDNEFLDCYDSETDVLTRAGWKRFAVLHGDDEFATVNLATDKIEYQVSTAYVERPYNGPMVQIGGGRGQRLNLCVTPGHRMVVFEGQASRGPKFKKAQDLTIWDKVKISSGGVASDAAMPSQYRIPAIAGYPEAFVPAKLAAAFFGWYVSEGSCFYSRKSGYHVTISQNPGAKQDAIAALLKKMPWKFHRERTACIISCRQAYDLVKNLGNSATKRVPLWIKDAAPSVIAEFIRCAVEGDGWHQRGGESYATISPGLADDIQELYVKLGHSASLRRRPAKNWHIRGRSGHSREQFHVFRLTRKRASLQSYWPNKVFKTVLYEGMIYCVAVPNGTLIVRRGGKVAVCGNCLVGAAAAAAKCGCSLLPVGQRARVHRHVAARIPARSFDPALG